MAAGFDLEFLRQALADSKLHILLGLIQRVSVSADRSVCRVAVSILPEQREIICKMSWEAVGDESGFFQMPQVNDMVLVAQVEGDPQSAFVLKRLTSAEEKIPLNAVNGDMVAKALSGQKLWLTSDTAIHLSKGDTAPTENLVLGQVLKSMLSAVLQAVSVHKHIGNLGYLTAPPDNASTFTSKKSSPVDDGAMLSDLAFTEKGS
jgi:ribosome-binding factor A